MKARTWETLPTRSSPQWPTCSGQALLPNLEFSNSDPVSQSPFKYPALDCVRL